MNTKQVATISTVTSAKLSQWQGMAWGMAGVIMFSGGIPASRLAVQDMPAVFVGAGRAMVAGILSLLLLLLLKQKRPAKQFWPGLAVVAMGAVFAFPILSALAMQWVDASHGTLVTSIMPLFTAFFGAWLGRRWPKPTFWLFALMGAGLVMLYSLSQSQGALQLADLWLVLASFCCGLSYAKGALLARHLGSWQVICWALVFSLPLLIPICWFYAPDWAAVSTRSWFGFAYLSLFSMFFGFFAWYKGLSMGGVAQVSQLQLLSPFLALILSSQWLGETVQTNQWLLAVLVVCCIAAGRRFA